MNPNDSNPSEQSESTSPEGSNAQLGWDENGLPRSTEFDDYYYSKHNGLEETRYTFIEHNQLPQRFAALSSGETFVVGETGFGTGLNFLAAWELWQQTAPADAQLHFVTVEKHPLTHPDLQRALALWEELDELSTQLIDRYPQILYPGFHRLSFDQGRVHLTLIIADACEGFRKLLQSEHPAFLHPQRGIDAWFLDGFAPSRNPEMWRPELFQRIHQLSATDATVATFSAAGVVKRGLRNNGFDIQMDDGFGMKREMVFGQLAETYPIASNDEFETHCHNAPHPAPWHCIRNEGSDFKLEGSGFKLEGSRTQHEGSGFKLEGSVEKNRTAIIVGAGIAGCHTARALADRGWKVRVLDKHPQAASEGSGNPQGVLYAKLSHRQETLSDFNLLALQFAQRHYASYWNSGERCGVLQLAHDDKTQSQHQKLLQAYPDQKLFQGIDAEQASDISGINNQNSGLFFPNAGWLNPRKVCHQLLDHPNIATNFDCEVTDLKYDNGSWQLSLTTSEQLTTPYLVLATASHVQQFELTRELPLKPIRGQVSYLRADDSSRRLKTVICGDGYLPPAHNDEHCLGATFDPRERDLTLRDQDHERNLDSLSRQLPDLDSSLQKDAVIGGRAAHRCTTPDYLPLAGPMPIYEDMLKDYDLLRKNARSSIPLAGQHWPGLYINVGHGSRGLAYTPICAEVIAAQMNGEPQPIEQAMQTALHPGRFWIRDMIRGKR